MLNSAFIVPVVLFAGAFLAAIAWAGFYYAYLAWRVTQETALKRDMVARGYSAQEIIAVIRAERRDEERDDSLSDVPPAKPIHEPVLNH